VRGVGSVLMTLTVGSLFSGIGGLDLGLERAGMAVRWQVENDAYCNRVLAKHWPDVARYGDIKELDPDDLEPVDLICGGFPCQDVSDAGRLAGIEGEQSGLWAEFSRIVRHLRPRYVLVENTTGLLARGMGRVVGDLAASGYDTQWDCVPAAAVSAPHLRARLWILAHARSLGGEAGCYPSVFAGRLLAELRARWAPEPKVGRLADGIPRGLAAIELHALGNAVVPQVAEYVGRRIVEFDKAMAA
jgi:DNA (cytosine-5)-methyltransferase 1